MNHRRKSQSLPSHSENPNIARDLPDRNGSDIPPQVQWFLSMCETAVIWYRYVDLHHGEPQDKFCQGVVDYWWGDTLEEPTFEMLFKRHPFSDEQWSGWPSYERFCYQQGAIVGYELKERFSDG